MPISETRACQNCKNSFVIDASDFQFYEKIKVPSPTWCSRCQLQKRLCFRNERVLYKRACDAPGHGEELISNYSKDKPVKVYDFKFWLGDGWDLLAYGRNYDFSKPFFEQMKGLIRDVPWPSLFNVNAVNSDYCNFTTEKTVRTRALTFTARTAWNCTLPRNASFAMSLWMPAIVTAFLSDATARIAST